MRLTTALGREDTNRDYRYQTTCSILTPANKAALKALAIAEGGTTVVPNRACELSEGNVFSGECYGGEYSFKDLHELTLFGLGTFAVKRSKDGSSLGGGSTGRSYGAIKRGFAIIFSLCFDKLPLLGKAQVGKAFSPSQCGRSHYPSRTTENSVNAETIRSLPFSGGS